MTPRANWPLHPSIYEIYPRSFRDSTGTGEGDLRGVVQGLEAIAQLGVDAIWLAPFYSSPMVDGGYDVMNHCEVDPRYGTLDDFDAVVARAHELDLRVMVDLVFNHTSDQHPWFQASIARDEDMHDWYVWRDAKPDGSAPNNWLSFFGEPAWTWNPVRRQFYLRQFLSCQPSLNLRHPPVQDALQAIVAFWRGRGVDGFRFDAVNSYLFDLSMKDNPPASEEVQDRNATGPENLYSFQDHLYDILPGDGAAFAENLRKWAGPDAWLLGEVNSGNRSVELSGAFTAPDRLDANYTVDLMVNPVTAQTVCDLIARHRREGCGLTYCLSCHDQPRAVSRTGDGSVRDAKLLALLSAALPGPLIIWQGEELGQPQAALKLHEISDPFDRLFWPVPPGREGARIPYPWSADAPNYGFTTGTPWLPMQGLDDIALSEQGPDGTRAFWIEALRLRRNLDPEGPVDTAIVNDVLHIQRGDFTFALNLTDSARPCGHAHPVLSTEPLTPGALPRRSGVVWRKGYSG
ncbi:alpha-amylase family glycosyl hydrolase [Pontivivens nitratireducens]|uniref:alpha-amylase family glycosyl hydrolase n=1 Tax=Pontivivens nitratireducens TaxID=2758038 RepID=UPI00163984AA|nr:alpha-amylase family glycosyl hydrolase [Pontibrevibacter nitratireducens]